MPNDLPFDLRPSRRTVTMGLAAGVAAALLPWRAQALDTGTARALVVEAVAQVNRTINSGKSEGQMYADFERLFARYADVPAIARTALVSPPAARAGRRSRPSPRPTRAISPGNTASASASSSAARSRSTMRVR